MYILHKRFKLFTYVVFYVFILRKRASRKRPTGLSERRKWSAAVEVPTEEIPATVTFCPLDPIRVASLFGSDSKSGVRAHASSIFP